VRHLASVILGPVLGFVAYVLFGFGATRISAQDGWSTDNIVGLLAMVGAGVAYAILVVPRLSPIGPAIAGVAYLGIGLWIITDTASFLDTMPKDILGLDNSGFGAGTFIVALAIPLLATLLSPNRWVSRPRAAQPVGGPPPGALGGQANQFGPPNQFGTQPNQFGTQPDQFGNQPGQFGSQPGQFGSQPEPAPFGGGQPGYPGAPPIGVPYSGPPSFGPPPGSPVGPPPGSPVAPSGYDPYGNPPTGNPDDPLRPDITRRIQ
jgi:hypothetical protein